MKKVWLLFIIIGCSSTKTIPDSNSPLIFVWTNAQQREIDSLNKRISDLEKMVVILPPGSVIKNPDGSQTISKNFEIDTIWATSGRLWIGIKNDTTNPHNGNDTLIHAPN